MRTRKWLWAGLILLTGANCVAILDGDHPYEEGDNTQQGKPCRTDAECDDKNPCTSDTCTGVCEYVTQGDGLAPDSAQTAADCQRIQCESSKPISEEDPLDVKNDNNSCTMDTCSGGQPLNTMVGDGNTCMQGDKTGTCMAGVCNVACVTSTDCNDGNPCTDDICNNSTGMCAYTNLDGVPEPGFNEVAGNCKIQICSGGASMSINDDSDVLDDNNPCTDDVCGNGMPGVNNVKEGTACTPGDEKVCDGNGACVECTVPTNCVNIIETECEKRSCVNNTCQIAYQGTDTLASPVLQTPGDCKKIVCNGAAGTTSLPDDQDLPKDGNNCTKDVCSGGTPSNPPEAQNFNCGGTQVCDGAGKCVGCTSASQCAGMDDFCKTRTCISNVCGFSFTATGTDLPTGQTAGDCKVLECDGMGNVKTSVLASDVPVDGNQCTQDLCSGAGAPSNPATMIGTTCSVGSNDVCDGNGNCKKSLGKNCAAGNECVSSVCVDGVCCNTPCVSTCKSCNVMGSVGTCTNVPKYSDDGTCTGTTISCNGSGACASEQGQTCIAASGCLSSNCIDGYCCNTTCTGTCMACNNTGLLGTCSNIPAGQQDTNPAGTCSGMNQCDGSGTCRKVDGSTCGGSNECLSGFCVDGVCCNNQCSSTCMNCNVAGAVGICSNLPAFTDDTSGGICTNSGTCDGMGICRFKNGEVCQNNSNCVSNNCVMGTCAP